MARIPRRSRKARNKGIRTGPLPVGAAHRALTKPTTAKIALIYKKSEAIFASCRWICRALRDRQIQSPLATNFAAGKISSSAVLASCGHLRPCKLPWMQVQLPWVDLPSPSGSSNPVAFGDKFCRWQNFLACGLSHRSASLLTLSASCGALRAPWTTLYHGAPAAATPFAPPRRFLCRGTKNARRGAGRRGAGRLKRMWRRRAWPARSPSQST